MARLFGTIAELVKARFRKDNQNVDLQPNQSTTYTADRTFDLPPGDSSQVIVSADSTQTLTNKTIDGDDNTVQDLPDTALKTNLGNANNFFTRDGSGIPESATKAVPTGTVVGTSDSQTLTNKTIAAGSNTISGLAHGSEVDNPSSGVHGVTGDVVGTTDTQTLTNKTITVDDSNLTIQDNGDTSKKVKFEASGITTATTRTLTVPDSNTTITGTDAIQTLTNKTIASPQITTTAVFDNQATARFEEQTGNGSNYIEITAPDAVTANTTFKLPDGDGTNGQVLKTDGSGNLDWTTAATVSNNETQTKTDDYIITDSDDARYLVFTPGAASTFNFVDGDVNTGDDTITETAHGLTDGDAISMTTTGTSLPSPLTSATTYFVVSATANTFKVSATPGGSAVNITATGGGGTHTVNKHLYAQLPTASANADRTIRIGRTDSATARLVVYGESSEFESGSFYDDIRSKDDYIEVTCDGTSWFIVDRNIAQRRQIKFLSSNLSSTSNDNADLRFQNMEIGKRYRVEAMFRLFTATSTTFKDWTIKDGGTVVLALSTGDHENTATNVRRLYGSGEFTMTNSSTLVSDLNTNLSSGILGNGTIDGTWIRLIELSDDETIDISTH